MSTTEELLRLRYELLRLRYELNVLLDGWLDHAKALDQKMLEYEEVGDWESAVSADSSAIRFRWCVSQVKKVLDA